MQKIKVNSNNSKIEGGKNIKQKVITPHIQMYKHTVYCEKERKFI